MDKFLQSRPALANNNQNEVTPAVIRPTDSDTDSTNDVVVEISLNSSCEVEQVSQDQGNDVSIDDIGPSACTTGTDNNPWPYLKDFFIYIGFKGNMKNLEYQCLLCKPSCKKFSCSATSMNNLKIRGGVEDTRLEAKAKAKDTKKIRGQGQGQGQPFRGQTLSRPRTGMLEAKAKDQGHKAQVLSKKKKKKGLHKNFSGDLQKKKKKKKKGLYKNF